MIKQVELTRFKKYKSQKFSFKSKGITLLVGGNNAGKSTLIHALSVWEFCKMILLHEKGREAFNQGMWGNSEGFGMNAEEFLPIAVPSLNHLWTNLKTQLSPAEKADWPDEYSGYIMRIKCTWDYNDQCDKMLEIGLSLVNDRLFIRVTDSNLCNEDHLLSVIYLPTFAGVLPKENKATVAERRAYLGRGMAGSIIRNMIYDLYLEDKKLSDSLMKNKSRLSAADKQILKRRVLFKNCKTIYVLLFRLNSKLNLLAKIFIRSCECMREKRSKIMEKWSFCLKVNILLVILLRRGVDTCSG